MPNSTTISFQQWLKDHNGDVSQLVFDWDWSLSASQYTRVPAPTYASTVAVVESTSFSAPLATDADKAQVLMNFRVLVKLTEDDWGSALLSYQNASQVVVDMTDVTHQAESGAEGGHLEWSMPGSVLISSGDNYELSATNKNIDYSDPYANVAICGYELEVYPLEPGGRKKPCDCGCSENNCQSGGMPSATARSSSSIDTTRSGAGIRTLGYGSYNELVTDSLIADGVTHLITELHDDYGRSVGYTYAKNGSVQQTVSTGYGADGRVTTAGVVHGGAVKQFNYAYLNGTHLLQTLTMPNNMTLTQSFEEKRDLQTQMDYKRGNTLVSRRVYTYDALGRPLTRQTSRNGQIVNDSFVHTYRSELASAQVNEQTYAYDYDNIGNRRMSIDASDYAFYDANELNQYSSIRKNEETAFVPTFDAAGNQTLVRTTTGTWTVTYNAENRPIIFQKTTDSVTTRITCTYDYMGRRATKKVEEITTDAEGNESITVVSNHRFIYRGYLQIACCDLSRSEHPCLWLITWDPTQPVATRPLAIQKDGNWFCYGWDLTKNICEVFGKNGYIRSTYTYSPFGSVTTSGDVVQPIQWSSEYYDNELALVYYNYRHYNPSDGRWINRDPITEQGGWNLYGYCKNYLLFDVLGQEPQLPALFDDYIGATSELKKEVNIIIKKDLYYRSVDLVKNTMVRIATVEYGGAVLRKGKKNKFKYLIVSDKGRSLSYNRTKYVNDTVKFFEFQGYCEIAIWHSHPIIFRAERGSGRLLFNARFEGDCTLGALTTEDLEIANGVDILGNKNGKQGYLRIVEGKTVAHKENPKKVPAYMVHRQKNPKWRYLIPLEKFTEYGLPFSEMDYEVVLSMHNIWVKNNLMAVITFPEELNYAILRGHPSMISGKKINTPQKRLARLLGK